jgi:hypothetical protein
MPQLGAGAQFYFAGDDWLRVSSLNSVAGVRVVVSGRFLPSDEARPKPFRDDHTPNTDRTVATSDIGLGVGWLQHVTAIVSSGTPTFGAVFVRVDVIRGRGAAATVVGSLLQGFVTSGQRLAWPGSLIRSSLEGAGVLRSIVGTDPAANTEISETVPTGARWRLVGVRFALVTDANAANRNVSLVIDDGANAVFEATALNVQAASLTINYAASAAGFATGSVSNRQSIGIPPDLVLPAGYRIRTETGSMQVGDNYSAPQLLVEEWLEGA